MFRINWIIIDTYIIIILILILAYTKIYKRRNRWDTPAIVKKIQQVNHDENSYSFTRIVAPEFHLNKDKEHVSCIMMIDDQKRLKFSENLCLALKIFGIEAELILYKPNEINNSSTLSSSLMNFINEALSLTISSLNPQNETHENKLFLILINLDLFPLKPFLEDERIQKIILINPKGKNLAFEEIADQKELIRKKLSFIFSLHSFLFLKNKCLQAYKQCCIDQSLINITQLNVTSSFKYAETLLLSKIIDTVLYINNDSKK